MGIHEDARQGTLGAEELARYLRSNPNVLNEPDPVDGLTPLAAAAVGGHADAVDALLRKGAKADAPSSNGATPLLIVTWKGRYNRARVVQLLLEKTPSASIDLSCPLAQGNTPLMFAVQNNDVESVRLLVKARASLDMTNSSGKSAVALAAELPDKAVRNALNPDEKSKWANIVALVMSVILYVVAFINDAPYADEAGKDVFQKMYKLSPGLDPELNKAMNPSGVVNKAEFVENMQTFVDKNPGLSHFFKGDEDYVKRFAQKAADLQYEPPGGAETLDKTIQVSLHKQVMYCDDSSSMQRNGRWDAQKLLVERITKITTFLEAGEGVALRFINQDVDESQNLSFDRVQSIFKSISWDPKGNTPLSARLISKVLEPLVYSEIRSGNLKRPLLISIITDGAPNNSDTPGIVQAIMDCGEVLRLASYPRESVKFMIGQVGTSEAAAKFLAGIRAEIDRNEEFGKVVYCTSDQLDEKFTEFHKNEQQLDKWLIETLFKSVDRAWEKQQTAQQENE
ncbi:hypothetical protein MY11210_008143 [Beauveria gryllotalpidicola]